MPVVDRLFDVVGGEVHIDLQRRHGVRDQTRAGDIRQERGDIGAVAQLTQKSGAVGGAGHVGAGARLAEHAYDTVAQGPADMADRGDAFLGEQAKRSRGRDGRGCCGDHVVAVAEFG